MSLRNERGQVIVEMILMMALFLGVAAFVSQTFQDRQVLARLLYGPWQQLAGMMENGVWAPHEEGRAFHPNNFDRHNSSRLGRELEPE